MTAGLPKPLTQLTKALAAEITAKQREDARQDEQQGSLVKGERVEQSDDEHTYEFVKKTFFSDLAPDQPLLVRVGNGSWHPVTRYEERHKRLTLSCATDLGESNITASVRLDPARPLEILRRKLLELGESQQKEAWKRASRILGLSRTNTADFDDAEALTSAFTMLNTAQRAAVRRALGSELSFIWGPPGTGKTEVISRIIEGFVRRDLNVLFVAPTNIAVDQALERVCDLLSSMPAFTQGLVQRAGEIELATLRDKHGPYLDPELVVTRLTNELTQHVEALRAEQSQVSDDLKQRSEIEELTAARTDAATATEQLQMGERRLRQRERSIGDFEEQLTEFDNRPSMMRAISTKRRQRLLDKLNSARAEAAQLRNDLPATRSRVEASNADIARLERALSGRARPDLPSRSALETRAAELSTALEQAERERQRISREVEKSRRLHAMTTQRSFWGRSTPNVDVVIVDEAGMVDLPTVVHLASRAETALVLAGDFRQLPAIVSGHKSKHLPEDQRQLVAEWLARDAFHASGVASETGINDDPRLMRLDTQFRMRPDICSLVNALAYPDAPLRTGRDDRSRLPAESPLLEVPVVLIDTSEQMSTSGVQKYNYNVVHATLIRELVRLLQHDAVLPARRDTASSPTDVLAVITPYRNQRDLLRNQLRDRFGDGHDGVVDTIHRFQGSQRRLVVVDTVTGGSARLANFFNEVGLNSNTCRLLNVAISRAADHLIVVANVGHLRAKLPATSEVHVLLDAVQECGQALPAEELIPVRTAADLRDLGEDELVRPAWFPADETDRALLFDFQRAQKRIEIYCAFMSRNRVLKFRSSLRQARERGVDVTVITRDEVEVPAHAKLIPLLREDGFTVRTRDQMHEKILCIDDILWHGSLNLFAHTRSTELMMRLVSRTICEDVRSAAQRARPTKPRGTARERPDNKVTAGRLYLEVPYSEKDQAKALGARWDRDNKLWYIDPRRSAPNDFTRWLPA